jgi:hypothetical protein
MSIVRHVLPYGAVDALIWLLHQYLRLILILISDDVFQLQLYMVGILTF